MFNFMTGIDAVQVPYKGSAPGTTDLNGGLVNTTATQTYNDPVALTADAVLASSGAGPAGNIVFANTVNSGPGGPFALSVNTAAAGGNAALLAQDDGD